MKYSQKQTSVDVTFFRKFWCSLTQQQLEQRMSRLENLLQAIAQHQGMHVEDDPD